MTKIESAAEHREILTAWFIVEFGNGAGGRFTDVSGLSVEVATVDFSMRSPKGDSTTQRLPGVVTYGELTFKRTLSEDKSMYDWTKKIRDGETSFRTDGSITLVDMAGQPVAKWTFQNAWPSKWSVSDLSAGTGDAMMEETTVQVELLQREI